MKSLFLRLAVAGVVLTLLLPALAIAQPPNIIGTYALYRKGDRSGNVEGYMRITQQNGPYFSIGSAYRTGNPNVDWQGTGEVSGNAGFYSWKFPDGKQGQTTFSIDGEGNLHGHVQGSGLDWRYVARRQQENNGAGSKR
jgi:hypothetical protein